SSGSSGLGFKWGRVLLRQGIDVERKAVHPADENLLVLDDGSAADSLPGLSLEPDAAIAGEVVQRSTDSADDRAAAAHGSALAQPEEVRRGEQYRTAHHGREHQYKGDGYVVTGDAAVKHHYGAKNKRGNAAQTERTKARHECLCRDHDDPHHDQGEARVV